MKSAISILLVIAIFAAGGLYFFRPPVDAPSISNTKTNSTSPSPSSSDKYFEFSKETFENSSDKKRILYFYASWCPICRPLDAEIRTSEEKIPADLVIIRVNFNDPDTDDDEKALAKKYSVVYQHTFVQIDASGNKINTWSANNLDEVLSNVN